MIRAINACCNTFLCVLPFLISHNVVAQVPLYEDISFSKGTFFGGAKNDSYLLHVAVDAQGFVYGTGLCLDIPATPGAYSTTCAGQFDVMVFKMDPTMTRLIWATYIGGSDNEAGGSIAVNNAGEVFVSGYTFSTNFPITNPADRVYLTNGQVSYFALKLSADGRRLIYSRVLGNGAPIQQQSQNASKGALIAINPRDEALVFSYAPSGAPYNISANAFQKNPAGAFDLVLSKLDVNGNLIYSTFIGGSGGDVARDICYAKGKFYLCGSTSSPNFPKNAGRVAVGFDSFVMIVDDLPVPRVRRSFVYGSSGNDFGSSLCYDAHANRVLLTGFAEYGDIKYSSILQTNQVNGGYVAAIDSGLTKISFITMVGAGITPTSVAARSNSCFYFAGYVVGTVPVTPNAFQGAPRGDIDGLLVSLDSLGRSLKYGSYVGGSAPDYSAAKVLIYEQGCVLRIIFGITTHSVNFPSSSDSYQPLKLNGGEDQGALVLFSTIASAEFTMSSKRCAHEYYFMVKPACPPLDLIWNFGDGSPLQHGITIAQHTYATTGTFHLTVSLVYAKPDTVVIVRDVIVAGPSGVNAGPDQTLCSGTSRIQLHARGAVKYYWSPGLLFADSTSANPELSPRQTTSYYLRGIDSTGCESFDTVTVFVRNAKPSVTSDTAVCLGQSVSIHVKGGASVQWFPDPALNTTLGPDVTITPTRTTVYTAIVTDGVCSDTAHIRVVVYPVPILIMPAPSSICTNSSLSIKATVIGILPSDTIGLKYQWTPLANISNSSTSTATVSPQKTTTYRMTVTTANGCILTDSVRITVQNKLNIVAIGDTLICNGSAIRLWAQGATTYRWSPPTGLNNPNSASPLCTAKQTTTYSLYATSGLCVDSTKVTVRVGTQPSVKALGDTTVCQGERVRLAIDKPQNNLLYKWSPAKDFEVPSGAVVFLRTNGTTNYTVTATNASGCSVSDQVKVTINNSLNVTASNDTTVCEGEAATIRITSPPDPNTSYTWTPNDGIYNPFSRTYTVIAKANKSYIVRAVRGTCSGTDIVSLKVKPAPQFSLTPDTTICEGNFVHLSAIAATKDVVFRWHRDTSDDSLLIGPATSSSPRTKLLNQTTTFTVTATRNGCVLTKKVLVRVNPLPQVHVPPDPVICEGESVEMLMTASRLKHVQWQPATGLSTAVASRVFAAPAQTTTYTVTAIDSSGCINSNQVTVHVKPPTPVYFSVSSAFTQTGEDATLIVEAHSSRVVSTTMSFDVVCDAGIFQPADSILYTIADGKRAMHITRGVTGLGKTSVEVARIKGYTMLGQSAQSLITIESEMVDKNLCPSVIKTPGFITVSSCFYQGRNIVLVDRLQASCNPNPASSTAVLHLKTSEHSPIFITLFDQIGQEVKRWDAHHSADESDHTLDLQDVGAGLYIMSIKTEQQSCILRVIKEL